MQELLQTLILPPPPEEPPKGGGRGSTGGGADAGTPPPSNKRGSRDGHAGGSPIPFTSGVGVSKGAGGAMSSPSGSGGGGGVGDRSYYSSSPSSSCSFSSASVPVVTPDGSGGGGSRAGNGYYNNNGTAGGNPPPHPRPRGGSLTMGNEEGGGSPSPFLSTVVAAREEQDRSGAGGGGWAPLPLLSPVQSELLEWLEGLAASSAREALHKDQQQQQQQQQPAAALHPASSAPSNGVHANANGTRGLSSSSSSAEAPEAPRGAAGIGKGGVLSSDGGGGAGAGGDWALVEVLLRVLSAVTRALSIRDEVSSCSAAAVAGVGGGGNREDGGIPVVPRGDPPGGWAEAGGGYGAGAMDALVETLPALPPIRELQRSAAVLVGGLAAWLARRPRNLEPALQTLLCVLRLEEEGAVKGATASMRDKGEDHVSSLGYGKEGGGTTTTWTISEIRSDQG